MGEVVIHTEDLGKRYGLGARVFLSGAILGMGKKEIVRKFDEIVAFAEIEQFLDTAVKHYSSGMFVRLAFAVAAHLEPDILLVDEVLSVGDLAFQRKCLGKMDDASHGAIRSAEGAGKRPVSLRKSELPNRMVRRSEARIIYFIWTRQLGATHVF